MAAMVVVVVVVLGLLQLAEPGHAGSPPSGSVQIHSLAYSGSGCPSESAVVDVSADGTLFSVRFAVLSVSTPGGPGDQHKNCKVSVDMSYPAGFVYTVEFVTASGYARLDDGVTGSVETGYFLSGVPGTTTTLRELLPPSDDSFEFTDKFFNSVYSLCGSDASKLHINSVARVDPPPPPGNDNFGVIDIDQMHFRLRWKEC